MAHNPYRNFTDPQGPEETFEGGREGSLGTSAEWDPFGGLDRQGGWVEPGTKRDPNDPYQLGAEGEYDATRFGGRRWGAQIASNRYRALGGNGYGSGPAIDQTQSGETRELSMGSLGMLGARAGGAETPADLLAKEQTFGASNAIQSAAASIKGGAGARAAAGRGAVAASAAARATGDQDAAALHARGIADAAGQYVGAAGAQRTLDISAATEQARLNAAQRAADEQKQQHFEQLGLDTKKAELGNQTEGLNAALATSNASRAQDAKNSAVTAGNARDIASAATGMISGATQAYAKTQPGSGSAPAAPKVSAPAASAPAASGGDEFKDYTGSDSRTKTSVRDISPSGMETKKGMRRPGSPKKKMSDAQAAKLKKEGDSIAEGWREAGGTAPVYDGKYLGSPFPPKVVVSGAGAPPAKAAPMSINDAIGKRVAEDFPEAKYGYFGEEEGGSRAPAKRYATQRMGQAGAMFGYGGSSTPADTKNPAPWDDAPPPDSFYGAGNQGEEGRRDIAMSDPAAKKEAYALGRAHQWEQGKTGKPVEWAHEMPKDIAENDVMTGDRGKVAKTEGKAAGRTYGRAVPPKNDEERALMAWRNAGKPDVQAEGPSLEHRALGAAANWGGDIERGFTRVGGAAYDAHPAFARDGAVAAANAFNGSEQPMAPPPSQVAESPGFFGQARQLAGRMTSDPEAKRYIKNSPMADANRSMAASSYEYRPEFTPEEQEPGEENIGPMADKMKADRVAGTAIVTDPETKMLAIDKTKGLKLVMGGLADLQRQVDKIARAR
jgi:hypothetical protein